MVPCELLMSSVLVMKWHAVALALVRSKSLEGCPGSVARPQQQSSDGITKLPPSSSPLLGQ